MSATQSAVHDAARRVMGQLELTYHRAPDTSLDGASLRDDTKGPLFRTIGRSTDGLTRTVLPQANAYAMIRSARRGGRHRDQAR